MSRWVNVENNFFSLPYPEERETICHYHFAYLHCARTQLNSSLTPCLPDFFFPAFIFLLFSWQLVHISVFCYVHSFNCTRSMTQLESFQFGVCKFVLAARLTSGTYLQEDVLSRARWCCSMYHYRGSGTLTVVIIRDEAKKRKTDKRNKKV